MSQKHNLINQGKRWVFFFLSSCCCNNVSVCGICCGRPVITWSVCWRLMEATHYRIDPQYYSLYHTRELERLNGSTLTRKPSTPCQTVIFLTITFYFTTKFFLNVIAPLKPKISTICDPPKIINFIWSPIFNHLSTPVIN